MSTIYPITNIFLIKQNLYLNTLKQGTEKETLLAKHREKTTDLATRRLTLVEIGQVFRI